MILIFCPHALQFFKLDVLCECPDGSLAVVPSSHIIQQLHKIIEMSSNPSQLPIGVLTTLDRDTWARSRERLISGEPNVGLFIIKCPCMSMTKQYSLMHVTIVVHML